MTTTKPGFQPGQTSDVGALFPSGSNAAADDVLDAGNFRQRVQRLGQKVDGMNRVQSAVGLAAAEGRAHGVDYKDISRHN